MEPYVNIHTHRPTGCGIELRSAGVHPWEADLNAAERLAEMLGTQLVDQSALSGGSCTPWPAAAVATAGIRSPEVPNGRRRIADNRSLTAGSAMDREPGTEPTLRIRTAGMEAGQAPATGPALRIRTDGMGVGQVPATEPALPIRTAGMDAEWMDASEVATAGIQALGEIGLDFACRSDRTLQTEVLRIQLRLACRTGLPVVLHGVRAFEPLMREVAACRPREVIFHGFIGSPEQARTALSRGCYLSFGERTFASPKSLRALHEVPLDRLFFETDDAPVSIERIYDRAARELGLEVGVLRRAAYENYKRIFEPKHENG